MKMKMNTTKTCISCKKEKSTEDFCKNKRNKDGLTRYCRECRNTKFSNSPEYRRKYYRENQEKEYKRIRNCLMKREYGIDIDGYNKLFKKQKGCCAICGKHQSEFNKALAVDHSHKLMVVRGLLCSNCNLILGYAEDDMSVLEKCIEYLNDTEYYKCLKN